MNFKNGSSLLWKTVLLWLIYMISLSLQTAIFPLKVQLHPVNPGGVLTILLLYSLLMVLLINWVILRSRWHGIKLIAALMVSIWGIQTGMTQIETWLFRDAFPAITDLEMLFLFLRNIVTLMVYVPAAVLILGKFSKLPDQTISDNEITRTFWNTGFIWKLPVLAASYVVLYLIFGYFVAWQFTDVRQFYSHSLQLLSFTDQYASVFREKPYFVVLQMARGVLWTAFGIPLLYILKGKKGESRIQFFLLFALLPALQLIFENPYMPGGVRFAHFWEVSISTGLFGLLEAALLYKTREK